MVTSLEHRVSALERQVRQLSSDIDRSLAKDRELLARLRSGQGAWRALQRMQQEEDMSIPSLDGHPFDESSVVPAPKRRMPQAKRELYSTTKQEGGCSTSTDQAVVFTDGSMLDPSNGKGTAGHRDANSI